MNLHYILWLGSTILIVAGGVMLLRRRTPYKTQTSHASERGAPASVAKVGVNVLTDPAAPPSPLPHAIVLGDNPQHAGIRISPLSDHERFRAAKVLPTDAGMAGRLNAGLQGIPALLIQESHRGRRLMEVIIDGTLVRAKDGVGLRAFAVDANGKIAEHAKLFEAGQLQHMVNAAAVWQIASVVVAQKHLADISAKLDMIRKSVQDVAHFLDEERRSMVTGTYEYLELAASAIAKGELPPAIRYELESCDRELLQIQHHLQQEFARRCAQAIEHTELAGTGALEKQAVAKYDRLKSVADDMRITLKTRVLAWHVLSLYPGEPALKQARMEGLLRSADEVHACLKTIEINTELDCKHFTSFWNTEETLKTRKTMVRQSARTLARHMSDSVAQLRADVKTSSHALLTHDKPMTLMFEIENDLVATLRMCEGENPKTEAGPTYQAHLGA